MQNQIINLSVYYSQVLDCLNMYSLACLTYKILTTDSPTRPYIPSTTSLASLLTACNLWIWVFWLNHDVELTWKLMLSMMLPKELNRLPMFVWCSNSSRNTCILTTCISHWLSSIRISNCHLPTNWIWFAFLCECTTAHITNFLTIIVEMNAWSMYHRDVVKRRRWERVICMIEAVIHIMQFEMEQL